MSAIMESHSAVNLPDGNCTGHLETGSSLGDA